MEVDGRWMWVRDGGWRWVGVDGGKLMGGGMDAGMHEGITDWPVWMSQESPECQGEGSCHIRKATGPRTVTCLDRSRRCMGGRPAAPPVAQALVKLSERAPQPHFPLPC